MALGQFPSGQLPPDNYPPPPTNSPQDNPPRTITPQLIAPRTIPPGQLPPMPITPWTVTPYANCQFLWPPQNLKAHHIYFCFPKKNQLWHIKGRERYSSECRSLLLLCWSILFYK